MSSIPQVAPGVESSRRAVQSVTKYRGRVPDSLPVAKSQILMVGQNSSWGGRLQSALEQIGCDFSFVPSLRATPEYVRKGAYPLLLLDSTVPTERRKKLCASLMGSRISIYQLFPVENGCWWLPVLVSGEECFGSPGFRTKELLAEIARRLPDGL
jgi:hypothetical protein